MLDKSSIASDSDNKTTAPLSGSDACKLAQLYVAHIEEKNARFQAILEENRYQAIIIASGSFKFLFGDDLSYPFKANSYFKEWLPLNRRRDAYLVIEAGNDKPSLLLDTAEDIWHTAPQALPAGFEQPFKIIDYDKFATVENYLAAIRGPVALVSEQNLPAVADCHWNPKAILHAIDYQRRYKTPYEQACVRQANRLAAPAHLAARDAFLAGASEYEIAAAYLQACQCTESEMPYGIIAGINEHAAVLHHYELDKQRPQQPLSFLLDAGVDFHGYASDISRTYAFDNGSDFAAMIALLDSKQQKLVAAGAIGKQPVELHELSHRDIAEILIEFGLINVSIEHAMTSGITEAFYPHGLGHHLGVNVHDKGTQLANPKGDLLEVPKAYPKMRHNAVMAANQIYTVEPGLYFIPSSLNKLRAGEHGAKLDWPAIDALAPYGGIRIEDNIILQADNQLENLTRDAFSTLT